MKMQFHNTPGDRHPQNHHYVVHTHHQMPAHNYYHNQYPWFRYPHGNYVPPAVRYSTHEMDILSRVYLGGVGLVGLLILYNLMDK